LPGAPLRISQTSATTCNLEVRAALQNVRAAILDSLQILTEFPAAGRMQSVERVRKLVTRKYSYLIYYEISPAGDAIVVITIQNSSRKREFEDN
jgi:toxin ParE1/3/4